MTDHSNCYTLAPSFSAGRASAEFGVEAMESWLKALRVLSLRRAVPQLIVKLDRMSRTAMSATDRLDVLRQIKRPLLKAAVGLPKPVGSGRRRLAGDAKAQLLEQRIYCLMARNLKQVLRDLDHSKDAFTAQVEKRRRWALRNLFRFLGRQIELGLFWYRRLPPDTWRELHDLYSYVMVRGIGRVGGKSRRSAGGDDFDPEYEYMRLLLLGLDARLLREWSVSSFVQDELPSWVAETALLDPAPFVGELDLYLVETSTDTPPKRLQGALTETFRGWVLMPAKGYLGYAAAARKETVVFAPPPAMRSASRMN